MLVLYSIGLNRINLFKMYLICPDQGNLHRHGQVLLTFVDDLPMVYCAQALATGLICLADYLQLATSSTEE